jgi:hypothetical protein
MFFATIFQKNENMLDGKSLEALWGKGLGRMKKN